MATKQQRSRIGIEHNKVVDPVHGAAGLSGNEPARDKKDKRGRNGPVPARNNWLTTAGMRVEMRRIKGVTAKNVMLQPFKFQVPPMDTFRRDLAVVANDYPTIQSGTFTDLNGVELRTISFETLVTIEAAGWIVADDMWNIEGVASRLEHILEQETPFQLVAWHPGPVIQVDMPATFRTLGIEEREPGTLYLTPSFAEWRDPVVRRRDKKTWPKKHTLTKSDTLASLGQKYWGKPSESRLIGLDNPGLQDWGIRTPIVDSKRYNIGDTIEIPEPPGPTAISHNVALT